MSTYKEIKGNLISLACQGHFDVIAHGCNCYCNMGAGIAVVMKDTFACNTFKLEGSSYKGDFNKLGQIDYENMCITPSGHALRDPFKAEMSPNCKNLTVVNAYTQFGPGQIGRYGIPLDYDALRLCLRKINREFKGLHVGLPQIGCGLAGSTWNLVKPIIQSELVDCDVTIVIYDGK